MTLGNVDEPVVRTCPVCWRLIYVRKTVFTHLDTAGRRCPMSNRRPVEGVPVGRRAEAVFG